jgi:hypothetical protein
MQRSCTRPDGKALRRNAMKKLAIVMGALLATAVLSGQAYSQAAPTIENLQTSAKALAGTDWPGTYLRLCIPTGSAANTVVPTINPNNYPTIILPTPPGGTPPRENWYAEPAQVGDNLYFLGTRNHNTYALVADTGEIILIDGNFEYATRLRSTRACESWASTLTWFAIPSTRTPMATMMAAPI